MTKQAFRLSVGICAALMLNAWEVRAEVRMPALFSDHMVLQRDIKIPVWGWADPGETVTVEMGTRREEARADADGKWRVTFPALRATSEPQVLTATGNNTLTFSDILVGDVWICSGQSNMAITVGRSRNAEAEIAASNFPRIRHFKVRNTILPAAAGDVLGSWQVASPETVRGWTGVGYFFGRDLHQHLEVPIGLINSSVGGTRIEAWMSRDALAALPGTGRDLEQLDELYEEFDQLQEAHQNHADSYLVEYRKLEALEGDEAHQKKYADPALDDSGWKEISTPANWESNGYAGLDGEVWYRRTVTIPADWAGKDLALELGPIDEIDTTFFNGVKVGGMGTVKPLETQFWNVPRQYTVPGGLVKEGRAVIAIRIVDQMGHGGPSGGEPEDMFLAPVDAKEDSALRISMAGKWRFEIAFKLPNKSGELLSRNIASVLFNGMVNGLIPYAIKGAIWYQGESNAGNAYVYRERFPAMINDWRARWSQGDFPFLWVQLANFGEAPEKPEKSSWTVLRESQHATLDLPKTGMALAIDLGEAADIHPTNKQDVGKRLALAARSVAYGESLVYSGPTYKMMTVEGDAIRIHYDHVGGGLEARGGALKQFAIAGEDRNFVWAEAAIDGDTVLVRAPKVPAPVAVRYAWASNPEGCNLYNREGLPASPFRTDTWKVPTQRPSVP